MTKRLLFLAALFVLICACDPLAPVITPTPQIIIVTPAPTDTPIATATPPPTSTPIPTSTPQNTPTPTALPCLADGCQMVHFNNFNNKIANENLKYIVYIPPCYLQTQKRYPYVILL